MFILPAGTSGGTIRLRWAGEPPAILRPALDSIPLIGRVGTPLDLKVSLQPLGRQQQPIPSHRGIGSGCCQRWRSSWRLASRRHPSRPWTRATIRAGSNSSTPARDLLGLARSALSARPRTASFLRPDGRTHGDPRGAQLLGQLIATRLAILLILGLIGRLGPARTSRAICPN